MEKKEFNSEFLKKVKDLATELQNGCESDKVNRGFVLLMGETPKEGEKPDTEQLIALGGNGFEIIKCISELATQEATRSLFKEGVKMGAVKAIAKAIINDK